MLADIRKLGSTGQLVGPPPDTAVLAVINFVDKHLIAFSQQYAGSEIKNEKGLTQKLCNILNKYARRDGYSFYFDKEYMEEPETGTSPQVDIGVITSEEEGIAIGSRVYDSDESFFSLEAKRLGIKEHSREKEYLVGRMEKGTYKNCGGVERFKKGIHGKTLKYGGLLGYVQEHDFEYWHRVINSWIDDLVATKIQSSISWTNDDKLTQEHANKMTARYRSINLRQKDNINLFHLWVNLVKN